jgi:hypothetical protein
VGFGTVVDALLVAADHASRRQSPARPSRACRACARPRGGRRLRLAACGAPRRPGGASGMRRAPRGTHGRPVRVPSCRRGRRSRLAGAGIALHLQRRWGPSGGTGRVRAGHMVVTGGPYARSSSALPGRPAAAAGSAGTPSLAVVCAAAGIAAGIAYKIPVEERALRARCGDAYARYAAEVPALLPRLLDSIRARSRATPVGGSSASAASAPLL